MYAVVFSGRNSEGGESKGPYNRTFSPHSREVYAMYILRILSIVRGYVISIVPRAFDAFNVCPEWPLSALASIAQRVFRTAWCLAFWLPWLPCRWNLVIREVDYWKAALNSSYLCIIHSQHQALNAVPKTPFVACHNPSLLSR